MHTTKMIMDFSNTNFFESLRKLDGQIPRDCIHIIFTLLVIFSDLLGAFESSFFKNYKILTYPNCTLF